MRSSAFTAPRLLHLLPLAAATAAAWTGTACVTTGGEPRTRGSTVQAPIPEALHGFARLSPGEWTTFLQSGAVLYASWSWDTETRTLRVVETGPPDDDTPWREELVYFVDPADGTVRLRGTNSFRGGRFEGTVAFGAQTAEATMTIEQAGHCRRLVRRWRFDGPDRFETELLEWIDGDGLVPLTSWIYTRSR